MLRRGVVTSQRWIRRDRRGHPSGDRRPRGLVEREQVRAARVHPPSRDRDRMRDGDPGRVEVGHQGSGRTVEGDQVLVGLAAGCESELPRGVDGRAGDRELPDLGVGDAGESQRRHTRRWSAGRSVEHGQVVDRDGVGSGAGLDLREHTPHPHVLADHGDTSDPWSVDLVGVGGNGARKLSSSGGRPSPPGWRPSVRRNGSNAR